MEAYKSGIMAGVTETEFKPEEALSRAMTAAVLYRLENSPKTSEKNIFSDVSSQSWYYTAVTWAAENKIVYGVSNKLFAPNKPISRQDFVVMLLRLKKPKTIDTSELDCYKDAKNISPYAKDAMAWAIKNKIIQGVSDNELAPLDTITRAQAAAILTRLNKLK